MWAVIKFDRKNLNLMIEDFKKKLGNDFVIYRPKILIQKYKNNKLVNKEFYLLNDYLFCFHKDFEKKSTLEKFKNVGSSLSLNLYDEWKYMDETNQFRFGVEYEFHKYFILRTGVQMKPNRFGFGFLSPINDNMSIAYGLLTHPILPLTHNVEFGMYF